MGEIAIVQNGHVQMRFQPHSVELDAFVTIRMPRPPAAPIGANILEDGELIGTVKCVQRRPFNRYAIVCLPLPKADSISQEIPDVEATAAVEVPDATPITALEDFLPYSAFQVLAAEAETVEEVEAMSDDDLLAIDGIGVKRLETIKAALYKLRTTEA